MNGVTLMVRFKLDITYAFICVNILYKKQRQMEEIMDTLPLETYKYRNYYDRQLKICHNTPLITLQF